MADHEYDHEPTWSGAEFRDGREKEVDENRQPDRSRTRDYSRDVMRRYARRSVEQGEELRRTRGEPPDWRQRAIPNDFGPNRQRGSRGQGSRGYPRSDRERGGEVMGSFWGGPSADRAPGTDLMGNFWGEREQEQVYRRGNPIGFTSARDNDITSAGPYRMDDWADDRDYSVDPGYAYEFGTDFDFLDAVSRPGRYTGLGPHDYQRSDEQIMEEVCERLTMHGQIDASGIEVQVQNGEVLLRGDVDRRKERYLAEDIASAVRGVKDINNQIHVSANAGARVRGMGKEETMMLGRIHAGMRVAGIDGKYVGMVREIRQDGLVVNRANGSSLFVPFRAIQRTNGHILLKVPSHEVDRQGWPNQR